VRAAQQALHAVACGVQELDWIIATSETHRGYPSLAARSAAGQISRCRPVFRESELFQCGVAPDAILQSARTHQAGQRSPIFTASLGPGLLFGGGWLVPA
jgi:hypothetical protein